MEELDPVKDAREITADPIDPLAYATMMEETYRQRRISLEKHLEIQPVPAPRVVPVSLGPLALPDTETEPAVRFFAEITIRT